MPSAMACYEGRYHTTKVGYNHRLGHFPSEEYQRGMLDVGE